MNKLILLILLAAFQITTAQERGFFSRNDMNKQEPRLSFGTEKQRSASISLGDINNDQKLDAVIANGRHWPENNYIFYNYGKGFNTVGTLGTKGSTSYTAELVDLDNDNDLDIVEINDNAPHKIYLNNGKGDFEFYSEVALYKPATILIHNRCKIALKIIAPNGIRSKRNHLKKD